MTKFLFLVVALLLFLPGSALAADVHIDAQDRTGAVTFTKNVDGSVRADGPGLSVTYTPAEAQAFADLVNPSQPAPPACSNWLDDDGDGFKDFQDAGCTSAADDDESNVINPPPSARASATFTRVNQGTGGTGFTVSAGRDEFIVLQGFWRCPEIDEINAANPGAKLLIYKNETRYMTPQSGTACGGIPQYNSCLTAAQVASGGGFNWSSTAVDSDNNRNIIYPVAGSGTAYGAWCAQKVVEQINASNQAGHKVDGVFFDDVNSSHDGNPQNTAGWNAFLEDANREIGRKLGDAGTLRLANGEKITTMANLDGAPGQWNLSTAGWDERQFPFFDAIHSEFTTMWPQNSAGTGCGAQSINFVVESNRMMKLAADQGTIYVPNEAAGCPATASETANNLSLAMCLVQAAGSCSKGDGVGNTTWWYPAFDRAKNLGPATGAIVSLGSNKWSRAFQNGTVTYDLNARTATIP